MNADIAVIGLAVMGENLALNIESRGYTVAVYNRSGGRTDLFMEHRGSGKKFIPFHDLKSLTESLKRPRILILMIKAGAAVDMVIQDLLPYLSTGDIIIDGGNSLYLDTERRVNVLTEQGIFYVGCGISGGEEGALKGPSLMPGGESSAWNEIRSVLTAIAAKASDGEPCCAWIGSGGAGHFVKMVHNGIEYGFMQLISEIYQIMRDGYLIPNDRIGQIFSIWNKEELNSYLMEITSRIFSVKEPDGTYLIDRIADRAGQKGTGKWTVEAGLEYGVPLDVISASVFNRSLSADTETRQSITEKPRSFSDPFREGEAVKALKKALLLGQIVSFSQGFSLIGRVSDEKGWRIDSGRVAMIWRGGCIIRTSLLDQIKTAFEKSPETPALIFTPVFRSFWEQCESGLRETVSAAVKYGIPVPALSAAANYLAGLKTDRLGINLLQAQRDFFGAHTYERIDQPAGKFFHTDWISLS